jgi:hypothetical protein
MTNDPEVLDLFPEESHVSHMVIDIHDPRSMPNNVICTPTYLTNARPKALKFWIFIAEG